MALPREDGSDSVYDPVSLREFWGFLSLAAFLAALASRWTIRLLPREMQGWDRIPPNAVLLVPVLSLIGLVLALIAGRRQTITGRIGFLLNAIVLSLSGLLISLIAIWWATR